MDFAYVQHEQSQECFWTRAGRRFVLIGGYPGRIPTTAPRSSSPNSVQHYHIWCSETKFPLNLPTAPRRLIVTHFPENFPRRPRRNENRRPTAESSGGRLFLGGLEPEYTNPLTRPTLTTCFKERRPFENAGRLFVKNYAKSTVDYGNWKAKRGKSSRGATIKGLISNKKVKFLPKKDGHVTERERSTNEWKRAVGRLEEAALRNGLAGSGATKNSNSSPLTRTSRRDFSFRRAYLTAFTFTLHVKIGVFCL